MLLKRLKKIHLFFLLFFCFLIVAFFMRKDDLEELPSKEILANGYKYFVFGSSNSEGIEIYDIRNNKFDDLLIPEQKGISYSDPVVGRSGKGYCIKEKDIFDLKKKEGQIITFDLNTFKSNATGIKIKQQYANLSISPDEKRLALVYLSNVKSTPVLGIINTNEQKIEKELPIDQHFFDNPLVIFWKPDNNYVILWDTITGLPAIEVDASSEEKSVLTNYPLDIKTNRILFDENKSIKLIELDSQEKPQVIIKQNATGHLFSLSSDGRYMVFGWLSGLGFENVGVMELSSKRLFHIKLKNHPSAVIGLCLW